METSYFETDSDYNRWKSKNPKGFVANMTKSFRPSYFVVHRADCPRITFGSSRSNVPGAFTQRDYRKVAGTTCASVIEWGLREGFVSTFMRGCVCLKGVRGEFLSLLGRTVGQTPSLLKPLPTTATLRDDLLITSQFSKSTGKGEGRETLRHSSDANRVGRDGEQFLYKYLQKQAKKEKWTAVKWVASKGLTPGWDIQYKDTNGVLQALEVKTTTGEKFFNVEITAGEWAAALEKRGDYHLVLVADIYGAPKLQFIQDPVGWVQEETARIAPLVYRFALNSK